MRMLEQYHKEIASEVSGMVPTDDNTIVPVDITSSARWFLSERDDKVVNFREMIPVALPPWPCCWLEFLTLKSLGYMNHSFGCLITTQSWTDDEDRKNLLVNDPLESIAFQATNQDVVDRELKRRRAHLDKYLSDGILPRWSLAVLTTFPTKSGVLFKDYVSWMYLDETGAIMDKTWYSSFRNKGGEFVNNQPAHIQKKLEHALDLTVCACLFSISLMHCKNVHFEDIVIPAAVQKKRTKRGIPRIQYKTLVIDPMHTQVRRERDEDPAGEQNTVKRALHIVRGHFKDYRETGLFGKNHGLFWWDMHVAGTAKAGVVVKDYAVKPKLPTGQNL